MVDEKQLEGILYTIGVVLGILGNIPVIVSICRQRSLLKSSYYYLVLHLAICDFLSLLFIIADIYSIFSASLPITTWSYHLCKMYRPAHTVFFTAGAHFLLLISALRYRAIVHPLKPPIRRRTLKIMSSVVYVVAIASLIPFVLVLRFHETDGCYEEWPMDSLNIAYTIFLACIQYFIPVACLSALYFKIGKELLTRNNVFSSLDARRQTQRQNTRNLLQRFKTRDIKPLLVSFTTVACFTISGFPSQVFWIVYVTFPKDKQTIPSYLNYCHTIYVFGTYVVSPYVYGALDKKLFSLLNG